VGLQVHGSANNAGISGAHKCAPYAVGAPFMATWPHPRNDSDGNHQTKSIPQRQSKVLSDYVAKGTD